MVKFSNEVRLAWGEKIQAQQASGLSISKWCNQHQIKPHVFYYWKKRLIQGNYLSFTELKADRITGINIEHNNLRIHLHADFDAFTLKRFLKTLMEVR